jgi:peptidoglycan L-alanyl-D-glutamate endopeptidase CwlK
MRDIKQLCPELQAVIPAFLDDCKAHGLNIGIGECFRSVQEQEALYAKGRTVGKKGAAVTHCRGTSYSSPHQWGVAFDFYRNDGKGLFNDTDRWFAKVGAIAVKHGLEWGGNWSPEWKDKPHVQLAKYFRDGTVGYLKRTYGNPDKFMKTWVKSDTTTDITLAPGKSYIFKLTAYAPPTVTVGTAGVLTCNLYRQIGKGYLYRLTAVGKPGSGAGVFANGQKQFAVNIK